MRASSARPSSWLTATAGMSDGLENVPLNKPGSLLKMMAATAPASETRLTFSSNVIVPRSISATRPSSPSAGRSPMNAPPASDRTPSALPANDRLIGCEPGQAGAAPPGEG